ncbi:aromatic ring-hydroxylating dioxygenase subunit alpha [Pendulispora albinea]|uniref:Aromatic ring-hydroxylating dioxygenase subunit alpha n=1 Tax=Pendulispora albinea TaxID=2741071 RepID=A0ABZ2M9N1_9BACT
MKRETQIALIERILHHVQGGTTDIAEQPQPFSPSIYENRERFEAERETLFRKYPLVLGFSSQIPAPGDFITNDFTGAPVLMVRDAGGEVRAFLNVCRHRGVKVAQQPQGNCRRFVCPYHAWSYDLDGKLHSLPEKRCFPNLKTDAVKLIELPAAERHGMIFVITTPGEPFDIDAYLGAFGADLGSYGLDGYYVSNAKNVPGRINWKLMIEANQESYHINFLHGRTAGRRYRDQCSLLDLDFPHTRSVLVHSSAGRSPLPEDRADWSLLDYADLVYFIFPNTLALWAGDGVQVISAFPQDVGTSIMQGARLERPTATSRAAQDFAAAFYGNYWRTIGEDIQVSETIQLGARARSGVPLNLGGNEVTIAEFHRAIERALDGSLPVLRPPLAPSEQAAPPAPSAAWPGAPVTNGTGAAAH